MSEWMAPRNHLQPQRLKGLLADIAAGHTAELIDFLSTPDCPWSVSRRANYVSGGQNLINYAIVAGNIDATQMLLEHGANLRNHKANSAWRCFWDYCATHPDSTETIAQMSKFLLATTNIGEVLLRELSPQSSSYAIENHKKFIDQYIDLVKDKPDLYLQNFAKHEQFSPQEKSHYFMAVLIYYSASFYRWKGFSARYTALLKEADKFTPAVEKLVKKIDDNLAYWGRETFAGEYDDEERLTYFPPIWSSLLERNCTSDMVARISTTEIEDLRAFNIDLEDHIAAHGQIPHMITQIPQHRDFDLIPARFYAMPFDLTTEKGWFDKNKFQILKQCHTTALHIAAIEQRAGFLAKSVIADLDVNTPDDNGRTPLDAFIRVCALRNQRGQKHLFESHKPVFQFFKTMAQLGGRITDPEFVTDHFTPEDAYCILKCLAHYEAAPPDAHSIARNICPVTGDKNEDWLPPHPDFDTLTL